MTAQSNLCSHSNLESIPICSHYEMYLFAAVSSCSPAANVPPSSLSVETLYVGIWNSRQTQSIQSVSAAVLCCLSVFSGSIGRIWVSHGHTGQCGLGFTWYSSNTVMKYSEQHSKVKSDANQFNFADALQKPGAGPQIKQQSRKNSLLKCLMGGGAPAGNWPSQLNRST